MKPEISPNEILTMKTFMLHHVGSDNRVSPEKIAEYMYGKATENNIRRCRQVRREINADDTNNILICTDRDEGGFYLADANDVDAVTRYIMAESSIAYRELEKVSAMKRKARRIYGLQFEPEKYTGQGRLL